MSLTAHREPCIEPHEARPQNGTTYLQVRAFSSFGLRLTIYLEILWGHRMQCLYREIWKNLPSPSVLAKCGQMVFFPSLQGHVLQLSFCPIVVLFFPCPVVIQTWFFPDENYVTEEILLKKSVISPEDVLNLNKITKSN